MDGYVRVSRRMGREGPGYISPDVQRESIQRWADYRGVEIVAWHFDETNREGRRIAQVSPGPSDRGPRSGAVSVRLITQASEHAVADTDAERLRAT